MWLVGIQSSPLYGKILQNQTDDVKDVSTCKLRGINVIGGGWDGYCEDVRQARRVLIMSFVNWRKKLIKSESIQKENL